MPEALPVTTVTATGSGGLTVRFGDRVAHCHTAMGPEEFAVAQAACDALLREMVEAVMREEATRIHTEGAPHG